jgi:hypothetical protein
VPRIVLLALAAFLWLQLTAPAPAAERAVAVAEAAATADAAARVVADANAPGEGLASGDADVADLMLPPAATAIARKPGAATIAIAAFRTRSSSSVPFLARAPPGR